MKNWLNRALVLLSGSLESLRRELNELDWKDSLSSDKKRLARLKMPEKRSSMVSALLQEATDRKLIKPANPENKSRKFAEHVPFWA